ncbi:MAG: hypothetical protein Q4C84_14315, partial [Bacillota bacterium]|nr:hypothetical protein [Bacillota bacterium]
CKKCARIKQSIVFLTFILLLQDAEYLIHFKNRQTPVLSENSCFSNQAGRSFRKAKSPEVNKRRR